LYMSDTTAHYEPRPPSGGTAPIFLDRKGMEIKSDEKSRPDRVNSSSRAGDKLCV